MPIFSNAARQTLAVIRSPRGSCSRRITARPPGSPFSEQSCFHPSFRALKSEMAKRARLTRVLAGRFRVFDPVQYNCRPLSSIVYPTRIPAAKRPRDYQLRLHLAKLQPGYFFMV